MTDKTLLQLGEATQGELSAATAFPVAVDAGPLKRVSLSTITAYLQGVLAFVLNTQKGIASGIATLGTDGKVPSAQLPAVATGDFIPTSQKGAVSGVASLGTDGKVPTTQLPAATVGDFVPNSARGVASGVATLGTDGKVTTAQLPVAGSAVPLSDKGAANGVATLGADTKITPAQLPATALSADIPMTQKGAASGVATLGADGKVTPAQLPVASGAVGASLDLADTTLQIEAGAAVMPITATYRRSVSLLKFIPVAEHAAIQARTSTYDCSLAIEAAYAVLDARGGGQLVVEEGLYRFSRTVLVPSNTQTLGRGNASEFKAFAMGAGWTTTAISGMGAGAADYAYCAFVNKNFLAMSLTDTDISVSNIKIDLNGLFGHGWLMKYVTRPYAGNCTIGNSAGGGAVCMLGTLDSLIFGCVAHDVVNSGFDHWYGFKNGKVIGCTVRNCQGQAIQFTATGGNYEDLTCYDGLVQGCYIENVKAPSGYGVGIIFNVVDNSGGSKNWRGKSIGNTIINADIGIAMGGEGGHHQSFGDTVKGATTQSFIIQQETDGVPSSCPSYCVIDGLTIIDAADNSAPGSIVVHAGTGHILRNIRFIGPQPGRNLWLNTPTSNVQVYPIFNAVAPAVAVLDSGSGNVFIAFSGGGGGGSSSYVVSGSDGTSPFVDFKSMNLAYRWRIRDNGMASFNGNMSITGTATINGTLTATGDITTGANFLGNNFQASNAINVGSQYQVNGTQVVGSRGAAISLMAGSETLSQTQTKANEIISAMKAHGLIG
ncbi:hypothetical protein [Phenylobacterium sp.]|uniref:hypothetical protein n=1 Tax=Phenylobacterium sp. TaxID=1871053 RepID=UPI0027377FDC|nr:hypothetical protein [Phenylobacterium sp.]MDP3869924.1 hypothetical protein [Phenylobacterium sp.]